MTTGIRQLAEIQADISTTTGELAILRRKLTELLGERVVIIGGNRHGVQIAATLVNRGKRVTVVEKSKMPGAGIPMFRLGALLKWLAKKL